MNNLFKDLEANGEKALKIIKNHALSPNDQKILKTWGINDAANLVGKSRQTIIDSEEKGLIPKAKTKKDTGRRFLYLKRYKTY